MVIGWYIHRWLHKLVVKRRILENHRYYGLFCLKQMLRETSNYWWLNQSTSTSNLAPADPRGVTIRRIGETFLQTYSRIRCLIIDSFCNLVSCLRMATKHGTRKRTCIMISQWSYIDQHEKRLEVGRNEFTIDQPMNWSRSEVVSLVNNWTQCMLYPSPVQEWRIRQPRMQAQDSIGRDEAWFSLLVHFPHAPCYLH
jgi:hypothetical protein